MVYGYVADGWFPNREPRPMRKVKVINRLNGNWVRIEFMDSGEVTSCPAYSVHKQPSTRSETYSEVT